MMEQEHPVVSALCRTGLPPGAHAAAASCPAKAETPEPELQEAHADAAGV